MTGHENSNVFQIFFALIWQENIIGNGENAVYQHFLLFRQCFKKASFRGLLKLGIMWERVKCLSNLIFVWQGKRDTAG